MFGKAFVGAGASGVPVVVGGTAAAGGGALAAVSGALAGASKAALLGGGALAVAGGLAIGGGVAYLGRPEAFTALTRLPPPVAVSVPPAAVLPGVSPRTGVPDQQTPVQETKPVPVPEPASLLLFLAGGAGAVLVRRRSG